MAMDVEQMRAEVEEKSGPGDISTIAPARFAGGRQSIPAVILDPSVKWRADIASSDAVLEFADSVIVSEGESDLVNFFAKFCRFEHGGGLTIIDRNGLFAEDMLAMTECHDCLAGVNRIGAGDRDSVDVGIGAKGFEVIRRVRDIEFGCE